MLIKKAKTSEPIAELLEMRWSPRAFDINKPVSHEQIISLCESARWAPSCAGDEPWRFLIWNQYQNKEAWSKAFETLKEYNQNWVKNAPVLICAIANKNFRKGEPNNWGKFDLGAACENIYLQAFSMGLYAHPMGGFSPEDIRNKFNIPVQFEIVTMIAIGYPGELDVLDDYNKRREVIDRKRMPLAELFFESNWNNSIVKSEN
jgi:nitroreductase